MMQLRWKNLQSGVQNMMPRLKNARKMLHATKEARRPMPGRRPERRTEEVAAVKDK